MELKELLCIHNKFETLVCTEQGPVVPQLNLRFAVD